MNPTDKVINSRKRKCENGIFLCKLCDKTHKSRGGFNSHMNLHTNTRPYKCDKCNAKYKSKSALLQHKFIHKPRVQCEICKKNILHTYSAY